MQRDKEGNLSVGSCPEAPDLEQDKGYSVCECVCPEGIGREGSILAGHLGLSSQQHSLLSCSGSITLSLLGHCYLPPGDSYFFPRLCPASSDSLSLPNDPEFGHLLPLSVLSQGCGTLSMSPVSVCHPLCRLTYSSHSIYRISLMMACLTEISSHTHCCM